MAYSSTKYNYTGDEEGMLRFGRGKRVVGFTAGGKEEDWER
jgi:hypothetical protein